MESHLIQTVAKFRKQRRYSFPLETESTEVMLVKNMVSSCLQDLVVDLYTRGCRCRKFTGLFVFKYRKDNKVITQSTNKSWDISSFLYTEKWLQSLQKSKKVQLLYTGHNHLSFFFFFSLIYFRDRNAINVGGGKKSSYSKPSIKCM